MRGDDVVLGTLFFVALCMLGAVYWADSKYKRSSVVVPPEYQVAACRRAGLRNPAWRHHEFFCTDGSGRLFPVQTPCRACWEEGRH